MVARTPPKLMKKKTVVAPLNPLLLRETLKKVDRCVARLQELQYTVAGGRKVVSGISLSPRSTRGYLKASLRCKQETVRIKNVGSTGSPTGKFPAPQKGEWKRMSLPAMLVGETIGEILQASQFAREILSSVAGNNSSNKGLLTDDPKTPLTQGKKQQRIHLENSELKARRKREKQNNKLQSLRTESNSPPCLRRARSRINFKVSPPRKPENGNETTRYMANRVSPRLKPWARKTVLFPNPLYTSTPSKQQHKFCKTKSPPRRRESVVPHKFLIKSPGASSSAASTKFQVKIKSPLPKVSSISPARPASLVRRKSPPPKASSSTVSRLRRSLSPARLANRLMSPLKGRKFVQKSSDGVISSGLKQRPAVGFSAQRIQVIG